MSDIEDIAELEGIGKNELIRRMEHGKRARDRQQARPRDADRLDIERKLRQLDDRHMAAIRERR